MSKVEMNEIVGMAVISDSFRQGLMSGKRAETLRPFEAKLEPEETSALLAVVADDLSGFAAAVENLIRQREGRPPLLAEAAGRQAMRWPSPALTSAYQTRD